MQWALVGLILWICLSLPIALVFASGLRERRPSGDDA